MRRPLLLLPLVLALVLSGCTSSRITGRQAGPAPAGTIAWEDCEREARRVNNNLPRAYTVECGTVTVPRDWNNPNDGQTFDIAVMRIRSDKQVNRIGSLITNPGGPGGSGLGFLPYLAGQLSDVLTRFDLVSFDPRGVGESAPVKCISDADLDASFGYEPDPVSDTDFQTLVALSRKIADGCGTKFGEDLGLFSTAQAARDMDAIRAALGDEKISYLGYSYGTLLGAVYAQIFPTMIRAMVLDGAVDPTQPPTGSSEGQAIGFERAFANFATWCSQNASRCPIAPDARGAIVNAINTARTNPVRSESGRVASAGWVFYAVVSTLYSQEAWPYLAQAIDELGEGNPLIMFLLADTYAERDPSGEYSTLFDANNAVNCSDSEDYPTVEQIRTLQSDWRAKYPLFGAPLALGMLNCALWPAKKDPYPVGPATGAPPIVVVGTTGDPATPYESTAKLADMLGTGRVLTWEGEGHTAYPNTACIQRAVDGYLIDLTLPAEGLRCPAR